MGYQYIEFCRIDQTCRIQHSRDIFLKENADMLISPDCGYLDYI